MRVLKENPYIRKIQWFKVFGANKMLSFKTLVVFLTFTSVVTNQQLPVCYEPLGCFPVSEPWFSLPLRPFLKPQSPTLIQTKIIYFTRKNRRGVLTYENLKIQMEYVNFKPDRVKTFFIVHGFLASGNSSWMSTMKDNLLRKEDANVFLVDWGAGAKNINYFQVASNIRIVGAEMSRFIKHLETIYSLKPSSIHLIGHSLGAHTCSYAAKNLSGIGRITGLDAAQIGFEGVPDEVRIDKTDANFVDLIHTNIKPIIPFLGFGLISAVGHVDIYVNGGLDQPGCKRLGGDITVNNFKDVVLFLNKTPFSDVVKVLSCSHGKSLEYFSGSIEAKCKIWAHRTGLIHSILNAIKQLGILEPITAASDKCRSDSCTVLGLETPNYAARGIFAATTTEHYPFCDYNPKLDEEIGKQIRADARKEGIIKQILEICTNFWNRIYKKYLQNF